MDKIEKVLDYITETPGNTNRAVLKSMLTTSKGGDEGTKSKSRKDINFFDYDGTIVESYTVQEWANVSSLPVNPSHEGLIAQGWNYTLSEINTEVSTQDKCDVGQMYITESGASEIDIHIADIARNNPYLGFAVNGTAVIDWGDGSATDTVTGTSLTTQKSTQHTYSAVGDYTIKITVSTGSMAFYGSTSDWLLSNYSNRNNSAVFLNMVQAVRIGANTSIGSNAFNSCYSLASVTIPNGVTSIDSNAFNSCYSLASVTIPNGVTSIGSYAFSSCYSLASITIPSGVTSIGTYAFNSCYSLASVTIPNGVTSIDSNAFNSCYSLASVTIPNGVTSIGSYAFNSCYSLASVTIPSGVTSIAANAFNSCYSLASITIPSGVTSIGSYAFSSCYSLASITIPSGVTSIGTYAFSSCYLLASITIPSGVTSIGTNAFNSCCSLASITIPSGVTSIGSNAFSSCYSLASVTIPSGVTSIAANAFSNGHGVKIYHIKPTTPPTLANANAFANMPSDCVMYVPSASLSAYQSATNWSKYASKMVGE